MPSGDVVVILGKARSGTSLLAQIVNILGIDLGNHLWMGNEGAFGRYEHTYIHDAHENMASYTKKGIDFDHDVFKTYLEAIVKWEVVAAKPRIWGFKEPATVWFLPLWQKIFNGLGLNPIYLLTVRHPESYVDSILNLPPEFVEYDAEYLHQSWVNFHLCAFHYLPNQISLVVDYDRWFVNGKEQVENVSKALGVGKSKIDEAFAIISSKKRHHQAVNKSSCVGQELYDLLKIAAETGKSPKIEVEQLPF